MSKEHALHNEQLCNHLVEVKGYNDWVVTTAFYSALHFVTSKIFPLEVENVTYKNIDHYCSSMKYKAPSLKEKKHGVIKELVAKHIKVVDSEYRWLFDVCINARYQNYQIKDKLVVIATRYLTKIKVNCIEESEAG